MTPKRPFALVRGSLILSVVFAACADSVTAPQPQRTSERDPQAVATRPGGTLRTQCATVLAAIRVTPASSRIGFPTGTSQVLNFSADVYTWCDGNIVHYPNTSVSWSFSGDGSFSGGSTGTQTASLTVYGPTPNGTITVTASATHPYDGSFVYNTATVELFVSNEESPAP